MPKTLIGSTKKERNRPRNIEATCKYDGVKFFAANKNAEFCPEPARCRQRHRRLIESGLSPSIHRRYHNPRRLAPAVKSDVPRDVVNRAEYLFGEMRAGRLDDKRLQEAEQYISTIERPVSSLLPAVQLGPGRWAYIGPEGEQVGFMEAFDHFLAECGVYTRDFAEWLVDLMDAEWPVNRHLFPTGPRDQFGWNEEVDTEVELWLTWALCLTTMRLTPKQIRQADLGLLIATV